jgi:hypothetical protein
MELLLEVILILLGTHINIHNKITIYIKKQKN